LIQTLAKNWWLLVLCGVLEAIISAIFLTMQQTDGPITFNEWNRTVIFLGKLAMATGACAIVAGISRSAKREYWLLMLNGLALFTLGVIYYRFVRFGISFRTIALLIIVMAISIGTLELITARRPKGQHRFWDEWLVRVAGVASIGFALVFFALGFGWIKMGPRSHTDLLWLGFYFGLNAISMLGLALPNSRARGLSQSGLDGTLPLFGDPRQA
jgi:uncharacterized membrane protein HdeD (DUF308 family)